MTSIQFHLRPSSRGRDFEGSLFFRVIHQSKTLNVTTSYRLYPSEWDEYHHCINYRSSAVPGVACGSRSRYMNKIENMMVKEKELLSSIIELLEEQGEFTVTDIIRLYRLRKSGVPLLPFVEKLAKVLIARGQYRTARAYRTVSRGLASFAGKECFTLTDICSVLLIRFQEEMLKNGKTLNTVSFYMRNLRAIYNRAIREQLIDRPHRNPFETVYTGIEQTRKRALNRETMVLLNNMLEAPLTPAEEEIQRGALVSGNSASSVKQSFTQALPLGDLRNTLSLFLFSFHARGMSFVDVAFLKKSDIQGNLLSYRRRKTGQRLEIMLTPEMRTILDSFREETKDSPYLFPVIKHPGKNEYRQYENGLKRQNRQLKRLGTPIQLSTHVARHTWASLAKQLNYPLAIISEALGHSSERTTAIYLTSFDQKVLDSMNRRISKAVKVVG